MQNSETNQSFLWRENMTWLFRRLFSFQGFPVLNPESEFVFILVVFPSSPTALWIYSVEEQTEPGAECQAAATEGVFEQAQLGGGSHG